MKKPIKKVVTIYEPAKVEKKWQKKWKSSNLYKTSDKINKEKFYVLDMFPYPSGEGLHVGHPKGYIATDIVSRMKRMQGLSVLHPMGFDAFGLPAENYALKMKKNPMDLTAKNVKRFKEQLEILGLDYDWSREINTTDPKYYKWTQWIFLQLFKKGLAYESFEPINWCPSCMTGLANEDVENGHCERCGSLIEKKPMRQWVLKITDYAERLLHDLYAFDESDPLIKNKHLLDWPESIKKSQKDWIGKSEGALIRFQSVIKKLKSKSRDIEVFTTRPDTIFGVTYVVLAPEHKLINEYLPHVENRSEVEAYIKRAQHETVIDRTDNTKEKTGVELNGIKAINPANNAEIPVWISDYVLTDYGTGAVMAVPAHDERDWDFAKKYNLEKREVIIPNRIDKRNPPITGKNTIERNNVQVILRNPANGKIVYLKSKKHLWNTFPMGGINDGESVLDAGIREVLEETGYKNLINGKILGGPVRAEYFAKHKDINRVSYTSLVTFDLENNEQVERSEEERGENDIFWAELKDLTSTFMVHAEMDVWQERLNNGDRAFIEDGVLVNSDKFNNKNSVDILKEITSFVGGQWVTKYKLRDWVFSRQRYWGEPIPIIHCAKCGIVPVPEKDLPVKLPKVKFYEPTGTGESPLTSIKKWVNVKCPICKGKAKRETNTMPQWAGSSWYYLRYEDPKNKKVLVDAKKEKYWSPIDLYIGGAEHATRHLIYARFWHKFLYDIGVVSNIEPFSKLQNVGLIMGEDGRKMSKRFGNVVNPDDIVKTFGADTLRVYEMFMGPFDQQISWNTSSIIGSRRFIEKICKLNEKVSNSKDDADYKSINKILHKTIKKVTEDIKNLHFNTAISSLMILVNEMEISKSVSKSQFENLLKLTAPFAPHIADELWSKLGHKKSIHVSDWPEYNQSMTIDNEVKIMVQINGKVRGSFMTNFDTETSIMEEHAKQLPEIKKWLDGKKIIKVIAIQNKLINIVIQS